MTEKIAIPHYIKAFGATINEGELNVADIAQQVQRVEDNVNTLQPFRNKIINGDFRIWQRGESLNPLNSSTGAYLADRWYVANFGSGNSASRAVLDNKAYLKCTVSSNALHNAQAAIKQPIEGVQTFAGKAVTLSFTAKADAVKDIFIEIVQAYGTDYTIINLGRKTLNTSLQRYIVHFELPPLSKEETVGASSLQLQIWMSAGSGYSDRTSGLPNQSGEFYFTDVQLEEGSVATAFEERPYALELMLCQRYYQKFEGAPYYAFFSGYHNLGQSNFYTLHLPTSMRVTPTVTASFTYAGTHTGAVVGKDNSSYYASAVWGQTGAGSFYINTATFDAEL